MPIYEYQCSSCHHHFDLMQKFNDPPATECPQCGKSTVIKLISAAGFQLKGTGWYATDFKDKKSKPSDAKPSKDAVTKDANATQPADSKPKTTKDDA